MTTHSELLKEKRALEARLKEVKKALAADTPKRRYLYVLECQGGRYYIGQTTSVRHRLKQHESAKGGAWFTKLYKPVRLVRTVELGVLTQADAATLESDLTYEYIERYGYECVRGGGFIQRDPIYFSQLLARYRKSALSAELAARIEREP